MGEERREEYRKTLFDRHGPDAMHLLTAGGFAVMAFFIGLGAFSYFFSMCGCATPGNQMLWAVGLSLVLAATAGGAGIMTGRMWRRGGGISRSTGRPRRTKNSTRTSNRSSCAAGSMTL